MKQSNYNTLFPNREGTRAVHTICCCCITPEFTDVIFEFNIDLCL